MKLCEYLYKIDRPCVFKGILKQKNGDSNTCVDWTPDKLAGIFGNEKFTFRIGKKVYQKCK